MNADRTDGRSAHREPWPVSYGSYVRACRCAACTAAEQLLAAIYNCSGTGAAPVTPENLRFAATRPALTKSWTFSVLTGLADLLDEQTDVDGEDPR